MDAKEIRGIKVLTDEMLSELISQVHPLNIEKVGEGTLKITQITDMTGLRTSHYMMMDLISEDNKAAIAALPSDTIVPMGPTYIISYENEGGVVPESRIVKSMADKIYTLTADDLPAQTAEGYIFDGWTLNGNILQVGDKIDKSVTLVAKWTPEVTITYSTEVEGANGIPSDKTVGTGYALTTEDLPTPELNGYAFDGWFNGETEMNVGTVINEDTDIQARWTQI